MRTFETVLGNLLGYGAFALWIAAIWYEPFRWELGLTGAVMMILLTLLAFGQKS